MRNPLIWTFLVFIALAGCEEESFDPIPDGRQYFPLLLDQTLIYRSDSIVFDDEDGGNTMDTLSGFVREFMADTARASDGELTYIVERSFRKDETQSWSAPVRYVRRTNNNFAYSKEGGFDFTKMRFPLRTISQWDPTALFDTNVEVPVGTETLEMFTNWSGGVISLDQPETIGGISFDSVMTCQQADDDNEIERCFVTEKYAAGVGLVFRSDTILDSRCKRLGDLEPCFDETWSERGEKGYILRQEIISID